MDIGFNFSQVYMYLEVKLLAHKKMSNFFRSDHTVFLKWLHHVTSLLAKMKVSAPPHHQHFYLSFFILAILVAVSIFFFYIDNTREPIQNQPQFLGLQRRYSKNIQSRPIYLNSHGCISYMWCPEINYQYFPYTRKPK